MKVKELIKYFNFLEDVRIVDDNSLNEYEDLDSVYEGNVLDVPWIYADWEVATEDGVYISEDKKLIEIVAYDNDN